MTLIKSWANTDWWSANTVQTGNAGGKPDFGVQTHNLLVMKTVP